MAKFEEKEVLEIMKSVFGFDRFKCDGQRDSVHAVLSGEKNVIVSMATNSGKSLCFQLASFFQRDTIILVLCPTLSLIKNQMRYLNNLGLLATSINSTVERGERVKIREQLSAKPTFVKFFYMCPEMAAKDFYTDFIHRMLREKKISHVVVDEAHCMIDKSFRKPSFDVIMRFRVCHKNVPFIALTTASSETIHAIQMALGMVTPKIVQSTSVKQNIRYDAVQFDGKIEKIDFLGFIKSLAPDFESLKVKAIPSGIIYCTTVDDLEEVLQTLTQLKIPATSFHAKMDRNTRFKNYDDWIADKIPIIVATTESFGLGIVNRNVKFVIHASVPKNLRAYYQEFGRAGAAVDCAFSRIYYKGDSLRHNQEMQNFLRSNVCRSQLLATYFGDTTRKCNNCDNCNA